MQIRKYLLSQESLIGASERCTTWIDFLANIRQALIVSLKSNAYTVFTELLVMEKLCIFSFASLKVNANMEVFVF